MPVGDGALLRLCRAQRGVQILAADVVAQLAQFGRRHVGVDARQCRAEHVEDAVVAKVVVLRLSRTQANVAHQDLQKLEKCFGCPKRRGTVAFECSFQFWQDELDSLEGERGACWRVEVAVGNCNNHELRPGSESGGMDSEQFLALIQAIEIEKRLMEFVIEAAAYGIIGSDQRSLSQYLVSMNV